MRRPLLSKISHRITNPSSRIILLVVVQLFVFPTILFSQNGIKQETCLTANEFDNRYASYSPDGSQIVFESNRDGNWGIYIMDSDGMNQERISDQDHDSRRPSWHPNGKHILFESERKGETELHSLNLKNRKLSKIAQANNQGNFAFASYSPNGRFIAVGLSASDDESNIFLINKKGKIHRQLTYGPKRSTYPRWSKDGKKIVYFSRKDTDNKDDEIYIINLENKVETRLTNWPKHNFCPSWSQSTNQIAYVTSMEETRPEIYIMDSDGHNKRRITNNSDGDTLPNWSPDGSKLLITGYRNGNYQICEIILEPLQD